MMSGYVFARECIVGLIVGLSEMNPIKRAAYFLS